jgi:hypothetical protein
MALAHPPLLMQRLMARRPCAWTLRRPGRFQGQNISVKISGGALMKMGVRCPPPAFLWRIARKSYPGRQRRFYALPCSQA